MVEVARRRKPVPVPDADTAGYWAAAKEHRLAILRCQDCQTYIHNPRKLCPKCWSENVGWEQMSGRGTVYSFIIVHHKVVSGFEGDEPYVVAVVELCEQAGLRIVSNVLRCAPQEVFIGMPVEVTFEDVTENLTLPQFQPCQA